MNFITLKIKKAAPPNFGFAIIFSLLFLPAITAFAPRNFGQTTPPKTEIKKGAPENQSNVPPPQVTQIDAAALRALLKREGANSKPLLVNFWATWCVPCREEFPDLVKINADYKDKIDFITVSLDELSEIDGDVPKFLAQTKATMPAFLLKTSDEGETLAAISKNWQGGLPFTILYDAAGATVFTKQGKVRPDILRAQIDKILSAAQTRLPEIERVTRANNSDAIINLKMLDAGDVLNNNRKMNESNEKGKADARRDIAEGKLIIRRYGLTTPPPELKKKYGIEIVEGGCLVSEDLIEYAEGYNEISKAEIKRKFGKQLLKSHNLE